MNPWSYKWHKFDTITSDLKKVFWDWIWPIEPHFFQGKTILDAGTGIGIPSFCIAQSGAKHIHAIDTCDLTLAKKNLRHFTNIQLENRNIYALPYLDKKFDVVVCTGVLQHLPNPVYGIELLLQKVKPNGSLLLWVYGREGNSLVNSCVEPFRIHVCKLLPKKVILLLSHILGTMFHMWTYCPTNEYVKYRNQFALSTNIHMVFDQLVAPISRLFTKAELESYFVGHTYLIRRHNNNSWMLNVKQGRTE